MWVSFAGAVVLLMVCTLLPLCRIDRWWVRGLDFPRLQLSSFTLLLLGAQLWWLPLGEFAAWALVAPTLFCLAFQACWILPYTPLFRKEVKSCGPKLSGAGTADALGDKGDNGIAIMTANVLTPNRRADELLEMVREYQPDILLTLESDRWWQEQLRPLEADYPYRIQCPLDNLYGMHVYSRLPLERPEIQFLVEEDVPSMHAEAVLENGARVVLHFLHPAPPSPTENETSSERDAELLVVGRSLADYKGPVIVAGDLNDVAWSRTTRLFRKISGLLDPRIGRGMFNSFHADYWPIRWPLDHLFHSDHFALEDLRRLPAFGSDHFPVLVRLRYRGEHLDQEGLEADAEDRRMAREKMAGEGVSPEDVHRPETG